MEGLFSFSTSCFPPSQPRELPWRLGEKGAGPGVLAKDEKETSPQGPFLGMEPCAELLQACSHGCLGCVHIQTPPPLPHTQTHL